MKKLVIFLVLFVGFAFLPFLGNKVIQDTIDQRLEQLHSDGLDIKLVKEEKRYLDTKLIYNIKVLDKKKFIDFLQQFSSKQLPPYTKNLIDGVELGVVVKYPNIPLSDKIDLDIYPTKLPDELRQKVAQNDEKLLKKIDTIIQEKKVLYHINYAVTSGEFSGYMKDFDETFEEFHGNKIAIAYSDIVAHGKGFLLAPESLKVSVGKINASVDAKEGGFELELTKLFSSSNFETDTTYITSLNLMSGKLKARDNKGKIIINTTLNGLGVNFSSNTQNKDAELFAKGVIEKFSFVNMQGDYKGENLQYDIQVDGLDKKSYIKLKDIVEKIQFSQEEQQQGQIYEEILSILKNGFDLKIAKFSLQNFIDAKVGNVGGFDLNLLLHVNKDQNILQKLQRNPKLIAKNFTLHSDLKFDKSFYNYLHSLYNIDQKLAPYKKEQMDQILFDIDYIDQELYINKQKVQ